MFDDAEKMDSTLFKSLVGSLRYLTCRRPDILFAVGVVSRFMDAPTSTNLKVTKRIFRYLKGTIEVGYFILLLMIIILWDIIIVITWEMMIEKEHMDFVCFCWVIVLFIRVQRNNKLLFSRLVKFNV